jgi:hypothetical protein
MAIDSGQGPACPSGQVPVSQPAAHPTRHHLQQCVNYVCMYLPTGRYIHRCLGRYLPDLLFSDFTPLPPSSAAIANSHGPVLSSLRPYFVFVARNTHTARASIVTSGLFCSPLGCPPLRLLAARTPPPRGACRSISIVGREAGRSCAVCHVICAPVAGSLSCISARNLPPTCCPVRSDSPCAVVHHTGWHLPTFIIMTNHSG